MQTFSKLFYLWISESYKTQLTDLSRGTCRNVENYRAKEHTDLSKISLSIAPPRICRKRYPCLSKASRVCQKQFWMMPAFVETAPCLSKTSRRCRKRYPYLSNISPYLSRFYFATNLVLGSYDFYTAPIYSFLYTIFLYILFLYTSFYRLF